MNIEARKIQLVQEFLRIDNEKIINAIENLIYKTKSETFEDSFKPMSLEEFNKQINRALDDEKKLCLTSAKNLKEKIKEWN